MSVRRSQSAGNKPWIADVYPEGRNGPRKRKKFVTKGEALAWESFILSASSPEWQAKASTSDQRKLSDLITLWFVRHGQTLADGERRLNGEVYVPG